MAMDILIAYLTGVSIGMVIFDVIAIIWLIVSREE